MSFQLTEHQLERAERLLGARFPESYRHVMIHRNGGELNVQGEIWEILPLRDDRSRTQEDVLAWTDEFRMWKSWPKDAIAIGRNGVGDALLFLKKGACVSPEVHVWWHETGVVERIASDFADVPRA